MEATDVTEPIKEVIDFSNPEILVHMKTKVTEGEQIVFVHFAIAWIDRKIVLRAIGQIAVFHRLFKKVEPGVFP